MLRMRHEENVTRTNEKNIVKPKLENVVKQDPEDPEEEDHVSEQNEEQDKENELPTEPKGKRKAGGRNNATKHGVFAQDIVLPGESLDEFQQLHQGLIDEHNPVGETMKEAVFTLARVIWKGRRADQFHREEMVLAQELPMLKEFDEIARLSAALKDAEDEIGARRIIGLLREGYRKYLHLNFPRSKYGDAQSWIEALKSSAMPWITETHAMLAMKEQDSLAVKIEQKARLWNLMEKKQRLDERNDLSLDKALRRIFELKAFAQISAMKVSQTGKIEDHITPNPSL
jgi:hypothetical protein